MVSRTRSYSLGEGKAEQVYYGTVYYPTTSEPIGRSIVVDDRGVWDGAFNVNHFFSGGAGISHRWFVDGDPFNEKVLQNFTPALLADPTIWSHLPDSDRPNDSTLAVSLMKATNPSKPTVDLPVSLLELRELPDLVKKQGERWFETLGSNNLKYHFGVKPIVSDFYKLLDFRNDFAKVSKILNDLKGGSLLRKAALYNSSVSDEPGTVYTSNSAPPAFTCYHTLTKIVTTRTVWGYVRWTPDPLKYNNGTYPPERIKYLARRIVLGSTVDFSTLWNALPWSWLADWYGNIGDWLEANRSVIPVTAGTPRVCSTVRTDLSFVLKASNFGLLEGQHSCTVSTISKSRSIVSASFPSAQLPPFSWRQLGILGSLAALRS
jgi:hypothetical protein